MKVRYKGPTTSGVEIELRGVWTHVPWGEPVDVPDSIGASLCEQEAIWERVADAPSKTKQKDGD